MHICILGTAAAEGWPALFCDCESCKEARRRGGKNIRTRSSLMIDEVLKIDLPPDTLIHTHREGHELSKLAYLLFTHSHSDHLAASQLEYIIPPFALQNKSSSLQIFGNPSCIEKIKPFLHGIEKKLPGLITPVKAFEEFSVGPYEVHSLRSEHTGPEEESLNYIIGKGGRYLLYTCDTGFYRDDTWDYLRRFSIDLVISECTGGLERLDYGKHMGFPNVLDFKERAEKLGITDEKTRWILTHFSHTGGSLHQELEAGVASAGAGGTGFRIAWDGMTIEL